MIVIFARNSLAAAVAQCVTMQGVNLILNKQHFLFQLLCPDRGLYTCSVVTTLNTAGVTWRHTALFADKY